MKNRYNSFGRHKTKAIFFSAVTAMAALQLTSRADTQAPSDMPPLYEDATLSDVVGTQKPNTSPDGAPDGDEVSPDVSEQILTVTENEIPFDVTYIYDDGLYDDDRIILKEGKNGYHNKRQNGIQRQGYDSSAQKKNRRSYTHSQAHSDKMVNVIGVRGQSRLKAGNGEFIYLS